MKRLYCTDLDSTIICNQAPTQLGICVATKNNKNASYMTNESYDTFIKIINSIDTLPITTRCEKSYNNIYLKKFFKYALVDNGAILVYDDKKIRDNWVAESYKLIKNDQKDFEEIRSIIEKFGYTEKWGSDFVLDYVNKNINSETIEKLKQEITPLSDNLLININKTSILVTFEKLSKGANIERFAKQFNYELFLTSGDNKEDESMFNKSTISLGKKNATYCKECNDKLEFCDFIINTAYTIIKNKL